jgi:D-serine deaminase-like pyridoxal phosphate-dependent protein
LGGLNELQPGSYVTMDATYAAIEWDAAGGAIPFRPAISILAGVVSRPSHDRAVVDVGWKSASSDSGPPIPAAPDLVFEFAGDEHGIVRRRDGGTLDLALAEAISLVPSHCDTTVNLYAEYKVVRNGRLEAVWPIAGRGCST